MFEKLNTKRGMERVEKDIKKCGFHDEKRSNEINSLIR